MVNAFNATMNLPITRTEFFIGSTPKGSKSDRNK